MPRVWRLIGLGSEPGTPSGARAGADAGPPAVPKLAGALNMAVDQALLRGVGKGGTPAVRFYGWRPACLSFGRNQQARGVYDAAALRTDGVAVVRRPTGGLAVLHDCELTYAVAAPAAELGLPRAAYLTINRALVRGLQSLGVPAELAAGSTPPANAPLLHGNVPCFASPAPGEVVIGARKLVGSAQCREGRVLLQHGSILLRADQERVAKFLTHGAPSPAGHARAGVPDSVGLADILDPVPAVDELALLLAGAFEVTLGVRLEPALLSTMEHDMIETLTQHFASPDWTWRR